MAKKKKDRNPKGKHAAQKPSKGIFAGKTPSSDEDKKEGSKFSTASVTSGWSEKSWAADGDKSVQNTAHGSDAGESIAADAVQGKRRKREQRIKAAGIALGVIVALLAALYFAGVWFFSNHFYPNTTIGDTDVSLMTADAVSSDLQAQVQDYTLHVAGQGLDFEIEPFEADASAATDGIAEEALDAVSAWEWPYRITRQHDLSDSLTFAYDDAYLTETVEEQVEEVNKDATPPEDATIAYDEEQGAFVVVDEVLGSELDTDKVVERVADAASALMDEVEIGENELKRPEIASDDTRLMQATLVADGFLGADFSLTLAGTTVAEVDNAQVAAWVMLDKDLEPSLSSKKMSSWVKKLVKKVDTVGTTRSFTRSDGVSVTVSGGDYGWEVDQDKLTSTVKKAVKNAKQGTVSIPCTQTANAYDEDGLDIGTRYVDIDLTDQHASFFVGGELVWEADIVSGATDGEHETPTGVYSINAKESPSTLVGQITEGSDEPEYETKVSYWMPFVQNYVGLHDATWQSAFGGTRYQDGYGSHGCVNLSLSKAKSLYSLIQVGDTVLVHS